MVLLGAALVSTASLAATGTITPFATVKPILETLAGQLPPELKDAGAAQWQAWAGKQRDAAHARLEQGDLDSLANLLLFGTSFTSQPPIRVPDLIDGKEDALLQSRLYDFLAGLRAPAQNERLIFSQGLLRRNAIDPGNVENAGRFLLENLRRVLQEQVEFAQRLNAAQPQSDPAAQFAEQSRLFRDRGVSLDTSLPPNFGIEEALRDLKTRGLLASGRIFRAAVIGPGLDFADKESGYDYYPQQTLQPFALYDSLLRLGFGKPGSIRITVFDISSRVLDHLRRARDRAQRGEGYTVQLPRDPNWIDATVRYWRAFGDHAGAEVAPIRPPAALKGLETRAVRIRPDVVLSCDPEDLDIVFDQPDVPAGARFDLVIATNVFVYYDILEQALSLNNISALLKPGGFLLTNDGLPDLPATSMPSTGFTTVRYGQGTHAGDHVIWYRRR